MPPKEQFLRWEWRLKATPEALWPFVSDTNHFNFDRGNPALKAGPRLQNARRVLNFGSLQYTEEPYEWVRPSHFAVRRAFPPSDKIFKQMNLSGELKPLPEGGSLFTYSFWLTPANAASAALMPLIMRSQYKAFDRAIRNYDRVASLPRPSLLALGGPVQFPPGGRERIPALRQQLIENGAKPELVSKLIEVVQTADDVAVARLRPYELAEAWGIDRRAVLELCLWSVRVGLLEFRWEVLCPLCRGPQISTNTLSQITAHIHCEACNVDDTANFDRSVEVTFRPNPSIRKLDIGEFCVGSPQLTPHIIAQQLMPAGDVRILKLPLESGRYRFRALQVPGSQLLRVAGEGANELNLRAAPGGWPEGEFEINSQPALTWRNDTNQELLMILERTAWSDKAATAAEVTALQLFRDLFAAEALRPGEQISVGSVTILFTDLRESTRLYREVGDAVAFGRVMNHFDSLREAIAAEQGALVKTIGDSVMAVFTQPVNAIRAILRAQHELLNPPGGMLPLHLKAGIHFGPCIAVTLNDRLDYFGTTVNIAARLEGQSAMGGIVISSVVRDDPEVRAYLDNVKSMAFIEEFQGRLKGFDDQPFDLYHISLNPKQRVE